MKNLTSLLERAPVRLSNFHSSVGGLLEGGAYLELSICKFGSSRNPPQNLRERNTGQYPKNIWEGSCAK